MAKPSRQFLTEVLFEFIPMGHVVKVSALDPRTNTEVSIVGDPAAGREALKRIAARKLQYVLAKRRGSDR